ncbi:MAG TPA: LytTR family DNA-binding domain-containing protein [Usitatibacter sp.]
MTDKAQVTALVVDDEPVARAGLRRMLASIDWIDCVGEAASGPEAIGAIDSQRPDLVFLDIEMPGSSGLDVLREVRHQASVVFTTAYARHAVAAFELGALDYLLKPFGEERLHATLDRVRAALGAPSASALDRFTEAMGRGPLSRLFIRTGRSIVPLAASDVAWFSATGDYVTAHAGAAKHLLHLSLNHLEERLDPRRFTRIHRTSIVNLDLVVAFRTEPGGGLNAEMRDGTRLPVSRARARELRALAR